MRLVHTHRLNNKSLLYVSLSVGFQELLQKGYKHLLPSGVPTNISGRNPRGNCSYDNIWVSSQASTLRHSGQFGVIREGLLVEGTTVSDHCPIWAEFTL